MPHQHLPRYPEEECAVTGDARRDTIGHCRGEAGVIAKDRRGRRLLVRRFVPQIIARPIVAFAKRDIKPLGVRCGRRVFFLFVLREMCGFRDARSLFSVPVHGHCFALSFIKIARCRLFSSTARLGPMARRAEEELNNKRMSAEYNIKTRCV